MAIRDSAPPQGTPCWADLTVEDMGKARSFYGGLFGWEIEAGAGGGGYALCRLNGRPVAGLSAQTADDQPSVWVTYLAANDCDDAVTKVRENGGTVLMEPIELPEVSRLALVTDPAGAMFGIWQSLDHPGAGIVGEPGSMTWNENMSLDWETNKAFYAAVFGCEYNDMSTDEFSYATFRIGGEDVAGIGMLPEEDPFVAPAHWSTYFGVEDVEAGVDAVSRLGGEVVHGPWDSPFGQMAVVTDNHGAVFTLSGPAPESP